MLKNITETNFGPGEYTVMALATDVAMANDDMARWDYFFTWGYMWEPLCKDASGTPVVTTTSTDGTVVARKQGK